MEEGKAQDSDQISSSPEPKHDEEEDIFSDLATETENPLSPQPQETQVTPQITEDFQHEPLSCKNESKEGSTVSKEEVKLKDVTVRIPDSFKDGDAVQFRLYLQKNGEDKLSFIRRYDDFQFLHHCLKSEATELGIIFPPLPTAPIVDMKEVLKSSKEQFGNESTAIPPEEFKTDCQRLEKYINMVLRHPLLVNLHCLEEFLLKTEAPARVNVSVGLVSKMSSSLADYIRSSPKDIDEFFQQERQTILQQSVAMKSAATNFYKYACSLFRLSTAEDFLANSFVQGNIYSDENPINKREMKLLSRIADVYRDENHCDKVAGNNCLKTLSKTLDFLTSYYECVKESLNRRNTLMLEYENATKALSSAKPQKIEQLTQIKKEKEEAYQDCTKLLKIELEAFTRSRVSELSQTLVKYGSSQITAAVDRQSVLVTHLNSIKALSLD